MTDNEITREKTFSEELPYFKEQIKEIFDNYHNPNDNEDPLRISVLRDSYRIVRKAEEEITCQKAEIERLKRENEILSTNADTAFQDGLNEAQDLYATQVENEIKTEAIKEFADKLKENVTDCHTVSDGEYVGYDWTDIAHCIDNLVKEVVGDTE